MSNALDFQNYLNKRIEEVQKDREGKTFDNFQPGDTISVVFYIMQEDPVKEGMTVEWRTQKVEGICVGRKKNSFSSTFSVRVIKEPSCSFKRTFMFYSPIIHSIKLLRKGKVRRAKLNYLDKLYGKAARIKERK
jgi:large subunit ribosomal protein L19